MTFPQYHRLSADEVELRRLPSTRETDTRLTVDKGRSKIRSFASTSAPPRNGRAVGNGKPGFFALEKTPSLPNARNERTLVGNVWNPGVWAQFPWAGFGALMLVVLCTLRNPKQPSLGSSHAASARFYIPWTPLAIANDIE